MSILKFHNFSRRRINFTNTDPTVIKIKYQYPSLQRKARVTDDPTSRTIDYAHKLQGHLVRIHEKPYKRDKQVNKEIQGIHSRT